MEAASGKVSKIKARSARLELPQRTVSHVLLSLMLGDLSPKAKQDIWCCASDPSLLSYLLLPWRTDLPFLLAALAFMSTRPLHQRLCSRAVLSMLVCPLQKMVARKVAAVESLSMVLHKVQTRPLFGFVLHFSHQCRAWRTWKNICSGQSVCKHTPPRTPQFFYRGNSHFCWLLASLHKNCKVTFTRQGNGGRECIELVKW